MGWVNEHKMSRHNFSTPAEEGLNQQINAKLSASYIYRAMAAHFDRDDVSLHGVRDFFKKNAEEETAHAQTFIHYLNKRGGRVTFKQLSAPKNEWTTALEALEDALVLEKAGNEKLLQMHGIADANDPQMTDFIEGYFLNKQVDVIKELADMIANIKRVGDGLGVYVFDKNM